MNVFNFIHSNIHSYHTRSLLWRPPDAPQDSHSSFRTFKVGASTLGAGGLLPLPRKHPGVTRDLMFWRRRRTRRCQSVLPTEEDT